MSPTATSYVGADVAQDTIAFCGPTVATIKNEPAALRAYLDTLPRQAHLVCEATGRHHYALHQACAAAARPLSVLNPTHARAYARSLGKLEKTDALDVMSPQSPLGSALLGKVEGDWVEYQAPHGTLRVKVLEVESA